MMVILSSDHVFGHFPYIYLHSSLTLPTVVIMALQAEFLSDQVSEAKRVVEVTLLVLSGGFNTDLMMNLTSEGITATEGMYSGVNTGHAHKCLPFCSEGRLSQELCLGSTVGFLTNTLSSFFQQEMTLSSRTTSFFSLRLPQT